MIRKLFTTILPLLFILTTTFIPIASVSAASCPNSYCKKFTSSNTTYYVGSNCKKNSKGNYTYSYYDKNYKKLSDSKRDKVKDNAKSARSTIKSKCDNTTAGISMETDIDNNSGGSSSSNNTQQTTYNVSACDEDLPEAVRQAADCDNSSDDPLSGVITSILNSIIAIVGLVAVVFVVIGGVQYMTSAGDATKTAKAKSTIIYACIGLAVCALAFAIVNLAIRIINGAL